jgi:hypothetical protein
MFRSGNNVTAPSLIPLALRDAMTRGTHTRAASPNRQPWEQVVTSHVVFSAGLLEESIMPVLILWAVPAVIFVGGVGYFLLHAH